MSQVALAGAAGISDGHVAERQSGRRGASAKQIAAVAVAFQVPLDLLVP
jgi:transcriptional regulator with XRE-family HTH domain